MKAIIRMSDDKSAAQMRGVYQANREKNHELNKLHIHRCHHWNKELIEIPYLRITCYYRRQVTNLTSHTLLELTYGP